MARYQYQIFVPGGNKTALVLGINGLENDSALRKAVQDKILSRHEADADGEVEQVGFISLDQTAPELLMTGGEFCGNATRSAAAYYLQKAKCGEARIKVSGTKKPVKAGLSAKGPLLEAWVEMPLVEDLPAAIMPVKDGFYWVSIEGISHLVVPEEQSIPYLKAILSSENKVAQINIALEVLKTAINENSLLVDKACGVIFLENCVDGNSAAILKMHPFVHVVTAGTTYYETACGSGAMCVGLYNYSQRRQSINLPLLQPSGKIITAEVECSDDGVLLKGKISGGIEAGETGEVEYS